MSDERLARDEQDAAVWERAAQDADFREELRALEVLFGDWTDEDEVFFDDCPDETVPDDAVPPADARA